MGLRGWRGTDAAERQRLLRRMAFAAEASDRRYADRVLVQATRWLKRREDDDLVVREAREQLRSEFPPVR